MNDDLGRNLTPELCDRLRRDMMKACLAVAETHGLTVEGGDLADIDLRHSFAISFRVGIPQEYGAIYSPDKAMFEVLAPHFGLEPSDYGCTFRSKDGHTQSSSSEALLTQKTFHHPAARKRILHVQLINPAHQFEIIFTGGVRLVTQPAPADPEQIGLAAQAQGVVAICHFFALGNRPTLSSAPSKKSFSSVSWPIFA
ncbi:hypothetical protein HCZ87_07480 [Phaeobacter sp. HF9A]|nr:hypothetical protein [Phaeobacter sp. HF9A]